MAAAFVYLHIRGGRTHGWTLLIKMAEVTLIDLSYLNTLSTFIEAGPQFSNQDSRLGPVIEKAFYLQDSRLGSVIEKLKSFLSCNIQDQLLWLQWSSTVWPPLPSYPWGWWCHTKSSTLVCMPSIEVVCETNKNACNVQLVTDTLLPRPNCASLWVKGEQGYTKLTSSLLWLSQLPTPCTY